MRIVCISDTHEKHCSLNIPEGDLIIHAGDLTSRGDINRVITFNAFMRDLPHKHKVVIAGNHDFCFEKEYSISKSMCKDFIYLQDESVHIEGFKIYGSPWQPRFFDWAFNLDRGEKLKAKWDMIPRDTDILVTHGPPHGVLDQTPRGDYAGCEDLLDAVKDIKPKLHIFGHIHLGYGQSKIGETTFVNASSCTEDYLPTNPPVVIDL